MIALLFLLVSADALTLSTDLSALPEGLPAAPATDKVVKGGAALLKEKKMEAENEAPKGLKLKYYPNGFVDVLDQEHPPLASTDRTEKVLRQIGEPKHHSWIMYVGDSNMRGTYWWWVNDQVKNGKAKLHKSKHFSSGDKWSDQEAVLEYPDGYEVRTSYRFLHASVEEFKFKTTHWHKAQKNSITEQEQKDIRKLKAHENITQDDPDAIAPSQAALAAASNRKMINFAEESPILAQKLEKYKDSKPNAVIMTEGWGGLPGCERFGEVLDLFKNNPETSFVWSPMYVTTRTERRHSCFAEKIAAVPQKKGQNFKFVDMWDWTAHLPAHTVNPHLKKGEWDGSTPYHARIGGHFMRTSVNRFIDAIDTLSN